MRGWERARLLEQEQQQERLPCPCFGLGCPADALVLLSAPSNERLLYLISRGLQQNQKVECEVAARAARALAAFVAMVVVALHWVGL